jgi:uncharacterized protein
MDKKKDLEIVKEFKKTVSKKFPVEKMILFGSRARGNSRQWSDYDIILVSDKFKGTVSFRRAPQVYDYWNYDYPVDFLCYTKEEFNKLKKKMSLLKEAVKEGIEIK